jgi:hypothetical protein
MDVVESYGSDREIAGLPKDGEFGAIILRRIARCPE